MKHWKHAFEKLAKAPEKTLETTMKHTQHPDKTLATYVRNICDIQINTLATYV